MGVTLERGYLEQDYLTTEYTAQNADYSEGLQFTATIDARAAFAAQYRAVIEKLNAFAIQFQGVINAETAEGMQFQGVIENEQAFGVQFLAQITEAVEAAGLQFESEPSVAQAFGFQFSGLIEKIQAIGMQYQAVISKNQAIGLQFESFINSLVSIGSQFEAVIDDSIPVGMQFNAVTNHEIGAAMQMLAAIQNKNRALGTQFNSVKFFHRTGTYTVDEYLVGEYLVEFIHVHLPTQFNATIADLSTAGMQFEAVINSRVAKGVQYKGIIEEQTAIGLQFFAVTITALGLQFRAALYNTDNLRVLCDFPSRGNGSNWVANTTASGDYDVNNLNTDIVEQVWQSYNGVKTGIVLTCDSGLNQGVFIDTLAMLNHNLTTSASVTLIGSSSPIFATIGVTIPIQITRENAFYIASDLPNEGFRYWRFLIDDPTNTNNNISIGTIIFGQAIIFQGECFSNPVKIKKTHYSDGVFTEGFTHVTNDRGIKRILDLDFRSINFSGGNYENMQDIFETARTNLKCLYIPTPKYPSRYAVFGKLIDLPQEEHTDNGDQSDYVNFSISVDESR